MTAATHHQLASRPPGHGWRRLPWEPLRRILSGTDGTAASDYRMLAGIAGVSERTVMRWRHDGIPEHHADQVALELGLHPANIWGAAWEDPSGPEDDPPPVAASPPTLAAA